MTNEEAIKLIKSAQAEVEWEYPMDYAAAFDLAIKALEQTRWIPVSERLPEIGTEVIVTQEHEDGVRVDKTTFTKHGFLVEPPPITAWMPMIKPYKTESEEEVDK